MPTYPFVPKSTRSLQPGDFWPVPLPNGRYACGRVLQLGGTLVPTPTRGFFGALMDWCGDHPPTSADLRGRGFLEVGVMHLRAITEIGKHIAGHRSLEEDGLEVPLIFDQESIVGARVCRGAEPLRAAKRSEQGLYPVIGYWGYDFIQALAEERFAEA